MKRPSGDRRDRPRFEIVGELWGTLDTVIGMPLVNVGKGGALVRSSVPLSPQSVHQVALTCDGESATTRVVVSHVRPVRDADGDGYLIGVQFLSLPSALAAQIQIWALGEAQIASGEV